MLGISYFKGQPSDYIIKYSGSRKTRAGQGLSFFYLQFNTQIVAVPTQSIDCTFVFNETSRDYQVVSVQGQLTYRISNPESAAELLNLSIDARTGRYKTEDLRVLGQRIVNTVQIATHEEIEKRTLEECIRDAQTISAAIAQRLTKDPTLESFGVELLGVFILAVKPTPEMSKALEAEFREQLLRRADEAIMARRASAVDDERKIREKELESDSALEKGRSELIALQGENMLREAENRGKAAEIEAASKAKALSQELAALGSIDPKLLLAESMRVMGLNADKVGQLNITSEILAGLLNAPAVPPGSNSQGNQSTYSDR
jgi:regulator of protease activity HflC (stomatin/prohibitin superfamily)